MIEQRDRIADTAGRRWMRSAQRGQNPLLSAPTIRGPFSARFFFWLRLMTLGPMNPKQCGEQGQRRDHGQQDADGGGYRQPIEEADAQGEHPEQGDADDDAGEEHGPP